MIVGAGAVGLGLGSCLYRAGHTPRFLVRDPLRARALERRGLRRTGLFGEVDVPARAVEAWAQPEALRRRAIDFVLVCTKSTQTAAVSAALAPSLSDRARLVLFQNGWGNAEQAGRYFPAERIYSARVITGFRRSSQTDVEITVHADAIRIGSLVGAELEPLEELCEAIARGGVPCRTTPFIERDLWAKGLYNCLLNPLGALTGVAYGKLAESAPTRALMRALAEEIFEVLATSGQRTHWPDANAYLKSFYSELLPATAAHESSMLQDLRAGRPTEIEALCGAVARLGDRHGVATPVNQALCALVHAAEARGCDQRPEKRAGRFSRKARTPSA